MSTTLRCVIPRKYQSGDIQAAIGCLMTPMSELCIRCGGRKTVPHQMEARVCDECIDKAHPSDWVREDFDEWSELTKERDAYRADAEAEWHRNPYA